MLFLPTKKASTQAEKESSAEKNPSQVVGTKFGVASTQGLLQVLLSPSAQLLCVLDSRILNVRYER